MSVDLQALENELKKDPKLRRFYELAREYQKQGRLDEAAALCEKGLALNPSQWQARILMAQICLAKGRVLEARVQVEKVLLPLPDNVPANHLAADIYLALGENDKALRHYQVVELFDPGRSGVGEKIAQIESAMAPHPEAPLPEISAESIPVVQPLEEPAAPEREAPLEEFVPQSLSPPTQEAPVEESEAIAPQAEAPEVETLEEPPGTELPKQEPEAVPFPAESASEEGGGPPLSDAPEEAWDVATDTFEQEILKVPEAQGADESSGFNTVELSQESEQSFREVPEVGGAPEIPQAPVSPPIASSPLEAREGSEEAFEGEVPSAEVEDAPAFSTITLAELYEGQGYPEKAVEIYQRILLKDPENTQIRERVSRLLMRMAGETPEGPAVRPEDVQKALRQKRVMHLNVWLRRVREARHV